MATKTKKRTLTKKQSANSPRNPINWVEVPVTDLERAKSFYGSVFGFKFELVVMNDMKMAFFPSKPDGWGCGGSLMQSDMYKPSHEGPMVYFPVADIEQTLTKIEKAGGKVFQHKKSIGQYGFIGFFEDSEGNRVGLHSMN